MRVTVDFETAPDGGLIILPDGYKGFVWSDIGAADARDYPDTYAEAVSSGHDVGFTLHEYSSLPSFGLEDGYFSFKRGHFASASEEENRVTFTAYRDGEVVGAKTIVLDTEGAVLEFGRRFADIDQVLITADSPIGMDDLVMKLTDGADIAGTPHDSFADAAVWHSEPFLP